MKTLYSSALTAAILLATSASPALAQRNNNPANPAPTGPIVPGIGIANLEAITVNSAAFQAAEQARQTHYAQTIEQARAIAAQVQAQLAPLETQIRAGQAAATPNQTLLQQQIAQYQRIEQEGQQRYQEALAPLQLSRAYVVEQIEDRLDAAITAVRTARRLSLIVSPGALVYGDPSYNINQDIVNELNRVLPVAQVVPPQGWLPRQMREAQAAEQQAQQPAAPAVPAGPLPEGR